MTTDREMRVGAALREALFMITAGGMKDYFDHEMYDAVIRAEDVERWRAALADDEQNGNEKPRLG